MVIPVGIGTCARLSHVIHLQMTTVCVSVCVYVRMCVFAALQGLCAAQFGLRCQHPED